MQRLFNRTPEIDLNQLVQDGLKEGSVLLDVRSPGEYRSGHIPGSINLPVQQIDQIRAKQPDSDRVIYLYCQSGARSKQAKNRLLQMGYTQVHDLGSILRYRGELER